MRLLTVGIIACAALGVGVMTWFEQRALAARVADLHDELNSLSVEAVQHVDGGRVSRIVEQRVVSAAAAPAAAVAVREPEPSAAERFERGGGPDPRRRADMASVMRNAGLDADTIECNATMCAIATTTARDDTARFVDAVSDAIGPGVVLEMVYEDDGSDRRVTVYAR